MKKIAKIAIVAMWLAASGALAKDSAAYKQLFARVAAAELPAKVAVLIRDTDAHDRENVTAAAVKAAIRINPAAAPVIVSSVARAVPEMAAIAAGAAATEQPKQATAIARAASAAAPSMIAKIIAAVCRAAPNDYRKIAVAVAQDRPTASKQILEGVTAALPELKPTIDRVVAGYSSSSPSVAVALDPRAQISEPLTLASGPSILAPLVRGPAIGPPFLPLSGTPTNIITPGTSGNVPPGERGGPTDYAQP